MRRRAYNKWYAQLGGTVIWSITVVLCVSFIACTVPAWATEDEYAGWDRVRILTEDTAWVGFPVAAISGDTIHLFWQDARSSTPETSRWQLYYKRSDDNGVTWTEDILLSPDSWCFAATTVLAAATNPSGLVHVVWIDYRSGADRVFYKRSEDGGKTWGPDTDLCDAADLFPSLALTAGSGSSVHLIYEGDVADSSAYFYRASRDGGATWTTHVQVGSTSTATAFPSVCTLDDIVYAVWQGNPRGPCEICWNNSSDYGYNWAVSGTLSTSTTDYALETPALASYGNGAAVVYTGRWLEETYVPDALYFRYSTNEGSSWVDAVDIKTLSDAMPHYDLFFNTQDMLWFVQDAYDLSYNHMTILVRTLDHLGGEWSEPLDLLGDYGISGGDAHMDPVGICNDDTVHIFWCCVTNVGPEWKERPMIAYRRYVPRWKEQEEQNKYLFAYPNPFRPDEDGVIRITYRMPYPDQTLGFVGQLSYYNVDEYSIRVYNVAGDVVRTIVEGGTLKAPGTYEAEWDGRNDSGKLVASGVYIVHFLVSSSKVRPNATCKVVVLR